MNEEQAAQIVAILLGAAPHVSLNDMVVPVWHDALKDLPYEPAQEAARVWCRTRRHFPYPVEIRELVAETALGYPITAEAAWAGVAQRMAGKVQTSDLPATTRAAMNATGGLSRYMLTDDPTWIRKEFLAAYDATMREAISVERLAPALQAALSPGPLKRATDALAAQVTTPRRRRPMGGDESLAEYAMRLKEAE